MPIFKNKGILRWLTTLECSQISKITIAYASNLMTLTVLVTPLPSQRITYRDKLAPEEHSNRCNKNRTSKIHLQMSSQKRSSFSTAYLLSKGGTILVNVIKLR